MSGDLFDGNVTPTRVPVMAPFKSVDSSPPAHTPSVDGLQPHPPRMDTETPSRAPNPDMTTVTVPITSVTPADGSQPEAPRLSGKPTTGTNVGPNANPLKRPLGPVTPNNRPTQLPPPVAGALEGQRVTSTFNREGKSVDPFDPSRLMRVRSRDAR
jgi:hypothetical protein